MGLADETILETFSIDGNETSTSEVLPGRPIAIDIDPYNYEINETNLTREFTMVVYSRIILNS